MAEETKAETRILYDADAPQRVPLRIVQDGAVFEVAHLFKALDDGLIGEVLDAAPDDQPGELHSLWWSHIDDVEGYEDGSGEPADVPFDERLSAVNEGLLLVVTVPKVSSGKPVMKRPKQSYQLRAFFDGQFVDTSISLANYSAEHYRVWNRAEAGSFPAKFGDQSLTSYSAAVHALFDALEPATSGYAGRVPLHHQELVIRQHFTGQSAAVLAKK